MAYDEETVHILRRELAHLDGITERKMFGTLCFMLNGHMVCGAHERGAMFRVGKPRLDKALALDGTSQMKMGGRTMGGMVEAPLDDIARRATLMELALENARSLPPKP